MMKHNQLTGRSLAKCVLGAAIALVILAPGCATTNEGDTQATRTVRSSAHRPQSRNVPRQRAEPALPEPTPSAKTYYAMARMLYAQSKFNEAEFLLLRVIREDPNYVMAYCDLSTIKAKQGRVDDALFYLQKGLKEHPKNPVLNNNAGICLMLKGEYAAALQCFDNALEAHPTNQDYAANRALVLALMDRDSEASAEYHRILSPQQAQHNMSVLGDFTENTDKVDMDALLRAANLLPEP